MPIDSENKRSSVLGILPFASGVITREDRPPIVGIYSGLPIVNLIITLLEEARMGLEGRNYAHMGAPALVAAGYVEGVTALRKFGHNGTIGTSLEDLWEGSDDYIFPTTAGTVSVVSTSANDTNGGTGANTVEIAGLNAQYEPISETITMNGTTPVVSVQSYIRAYRAAVTTVGSGGVNAGVITGSIGAADGFIIDTSDGQTMQAIYTIPAGYRGILVDWSGSCPRGDDVSFSLHKRIFNGSWRIQDRQFTYQGRFHQPSFGADVFPEKTDIKIQVASSLTASEGTGEFNIWLVPERYFTLNGL